MFRGRYDYTLDDKGRLSIPSKFREILSANYDMKLILTYLDSCIVSYPEPEWAIISEKISSQTLSKEARRVVRVLYSNVSECPIDRLGRILIPQSLRNDAGIKKNAVIIGMNRKIEIWAEETWVGVVREATSDRDKLEEIVSELGL